MRYNFKTEYKLHATPEFLWELLSDVESWPVKFKYFSNVQIRGNRKILEENTIIDCEVRGLLPVIIKFNTEIVKIKPHKELKVISRGDLEGTGHWMLDEYNDGTVSTFTWIVEPRKKFMRVMSKFLTGRLLLIYNHRLVMRKGYRLLRLVIEKNKIS